MKIKVHYDNVKFRLRNSGKIKTFLAGVIRKENKMPGALVFIFTGDETIRKINKEFLGHNRYTDVISFDYSGGMVINGEIYIGINTVVKNAAEFKVSLKEEVLRVMIHGILHLLGYKDEERGEKERMHAVQEDLLIRYSKFSNEL